MAKLFYKDDNGEKAFITINAENPHVLIGRSKECNIKTNNITVSRNHCQVIFTGGQFKLFDLGSSNGTYYKKQKVKEQILEDNEIFFCGNFEIKFELEDHERMPPEPVHDISAEEIIELSTSDEEKCDILIEEKIQKESAVPSDIEQPRPLSFDTFAYDDVVSQIRKDKEKSVTPEVKGADIPPMVYETTTERVHHEEEEKEPKPEFATPGVEEPELYSANRSVARDLEERISELENLLFLKDGELEQMNKSLADKERQIQSLTAAYTELQRKIAELTRVSAGATDELNRLRTAYEGLKNELRDKENLRDDFSKKEAEIKETEARFRDELMKKDQEIARLESLLVSAEKEKQSALEQSQISAAIRNEFDRQSKKITELGEQIDALKAERDALLEENKRWEGLKKEFERERQTELDEKKKLEGQIAAQREKLRLFEEAEAKFEKIGLENAHLKKENEELRSANKTYIKKVSKLIEEKEAIEKELAALKGSSIPQDAKERFDVEKSSLMAEKRALLSEKLSLQAEKAALESDNMKLQNLLKAAAEEKKELQSKLDRLVEKLALIEKERVPAPAPNNAQGVNFDALFDRLNDITSAFKTNIEVLENYILEVSSKLPESKENTMLIEMLQDAFRELKAGSQDFKNELKSHRSK